MAWQSVRGPRRISVFVLVPDGSTVRIITGHVSTVGSSIGRPISTGGRVSPPFLLVPSVDRGRPAGCWLHGYPSRPTWPMGMVRRTGDGKIHRISCGLPGITVHSLCKSFVNSMWEQMSTKPPIVPLFLAIVSLFTIYI